MDLPELAQRSKQLLSTVTEYKNFIEATKKQLDETMKNAAAQIESAIKSKQGKTVKSAYEQALAQLPEKDRKAVQEVLDHLTNGDPEHSSADILKGLFISTAVGVTPTVAMVAFQKAAAYCRVQEALLRGQALRGFQAELAAAGGETNMMLEMEAAAQALRGYEVLATEAEGFAVWAERFAMVGRVATRVSVVLIPVSILLEVGLYFHRKHEEAEAEKQREEAKAHLKDSIRNLATTRLYMRLSLNYLERLKLQSGHFFDIATGISTGKDISWILDDISNDAKKYETECSVEAAYKQLQAFDITNKARTDQDPLLKDMKDLHREQLKGLAEKEKAKK